MSQHTYLVPEATSNLLDGFFHPWSTRYQETEASELHSWRATLVFTGQIKDRSMPMEHVAAMHKTLLSLAVVPGLVEISSSLFTSYLVNGKEINHGLVELGQVTDYEKVLTLTVHFEKA